MRNKGKALEMIDGKSHSCSFAPVVVSGSSSSFLTTLSPHVDVVVVVVVVVVVSDRALTLPQTAVQLNLGPRTLQHTQNLGCRKKMHIVIYMVCIILPHTLLHA